MYDQYYTERISKFMKWAEERIAQEHAKNQKIIQECGTDEMSDTPKILRDNPEIRRSAT